MPARISILLVEDDARDAVLVKHELRQAGYDAKCKRVQQLEQFLSELSRRLPDVIPCDNGLMGLDGLEVLALARQRCPELPFVFLTGAVTDKLRQSGANACVQKDRMASGLIPAIESALHNRGTLHHSTHYEFGTSNQTDQGRVG